VTGFGPDDEIDLIIEIEKCQIKVHLFDTALALQHESIKLLSEPFLKGLPLLRRLGYRLTWNSDIPDFLEQLRRIKIISGKERMLLEDATTALNNYQEKKKKETNQNQNTYSTGKARKTFIDLLITL